MSGSDDLEFASTERKVWLGFGLALTCLAVIGVVSYFSAARSNETAQSVEHTYRALGSLETLLAAVTDCETAGRGYVITGDESYLEPYRRSAGAIEPQAGRVRELIADDPTQQQRLKSVMS